MITAMQEPPSLNKKGYYMSFDMYLNKNVIVNLLPTPDYKKTFIMLHMTLNGNL